MGFPSAGAVQVTAIDFRPATTVTLAGSSGWGGVAWAGEGPATIAATNTSNIDALAASHLEPVRRVRGPSIFNTCTTPVFEDSGRASPDRVLTLKLVIFAVKSFIIGRKH